jgi:ubiquitin C-terminal hydrolase
MIFKKHICLFLAFFLLVSNSGLAFNVHFCEGKIASVTSVFSKEEVCEIPVKVEESCCAKPEQSHKKCCSDKEVNLKNKPEKVIVKIITFDIDAVFFFISDNTLVFSSQVEASVSQNFDFYCDANAPPLYILYCQYTFYA